VFVRPEDLSIVPADAGQANVLTRIVTAQSYQGSFTHVIVRVGTLDVLLTVPGAAVVERHPTGTPVALSLDLANASIIEA